MGAQAALFRKKVVSFILIKTLYRWVDGLSVTGRTGGGFAATSLSQVQLRPMPSLTDARAPRKPCPRGTAFTIVIISQNSPSLVEKSEPLRHNPGYRVPACTRLIAFQILRRSSPFADSHALTFIIRVSLKRRPTAFELLYRETRLPLL